MSRPFWGHSEHFSQSWLIIQKWLIVKQNGRKFRINVVILIFLTMNMSRSFGSHFAKIWAKLEHGSSQNENDENLGLGVYVIWMLLLLTLNMSMSFWVILSCTFHKSGLNSKMAHCRAKRREILGLGGPWSMHIDIFTLNMSRSFEVICPKNRIAQKWQ